MFKAEALRNAGWIESIVRPADGQLVAYFFAPFDSIYVGCYEAETDSVAGSAGFTTWFPEVLCWYPLPS